MKYYSNNFQKHINALDIHTTATSGYRFSREKYNITGIAIKVHAGEPISDDDVTNIRKFIDGLIMWDKWFRSDRRRVDNVLWLLDAMDDDCPDFSDYQADIVNE